MRHRSARPPTARSPRRRRRSHLRTRRALRSGIRRNGRSPASRSSAWIRRANSTAAWSTRSTSSSQACSARRSRIARSSVASLRATTETGLPLEKCEVYKHVLGGGFGRRGGAQDYVRQAASIAKQMPGVPIKLIWSREEDTTHDFFRPISQCRGVAGLDANGNLVGLHMRISGQSINAFLNSPQAKDGKDDRQLQGYSEKPGDAQLGYTVPNLLIEYAMRNTHVPVGPWRGVNTNQNGVYMECFIDEVAQEAGADPVEFRRKL